MGEVTTALTFTEDENMTGGDDLILAVLLLNV